jgi:hypothetical protein
MNSDEPGTEESGRRHGGRVNDEGWIMNVE